MVFAVQYSTGDIKSPRQGEKLGIRIVNLYIGAKQKQSSDLWIITQDQGKGTPSRTRNHDDLFPYFFGNGQGLFGTVEILLSCKVQKGFGLNQSMVIESR